MRDALGVELRMGQRVAVPCNSKFKIGVLYNYKPNNSRYYRELAYHLERVAQGHDANEHGQVYQEWHRRFYTQERLEAESHKYYIQFEDGRKRTMADRRSIIGLGDDAEIQI